MSITKLMKLIKHLLVTVMSEIVRYSIRGGAKFGVFLSLFLGLTVAVRADDVNLGDLPRPPPGLKPVFVISGDHLYTNIGMPSGMECYNPQFLDLYTQEELERYKVVCHTREQMAAYMALLDKTCKEKKCIITSIGAGVFSFDMYEMGEGVKGRPYFDPNSPQGVAAEWRDTLLRMCRYHNDPSMAAHIPRPLKDYIDLLKEDKKFLGWVNGSCTNTKCAETLLDYETWKNGGKCETKATQLISDKPPNALGRCDNCRIVKAFVDNYKAYEEAMRNPPVEQKPLVPQPAPSLVGPGSSKPGPGLTDMRPGPQNPQIPQPAPSLVGPGNQTRPGLYDRMRPYNPNWNGIVDSFGPMLIGAQDLYGAGTSLVLIGSGGVSPDRIPGQTMLTGVQGAAGTYMLIGGAGMALTSMGAPAIGGALIGAAAPAASIVLVPIVAGGVGYGAGNLLGGALTGGSMEGLADAVNVISVPAVGANCSQRVSFLGKTQGSFCGIEGRMKHWISRDCAGCCDKSFKDLSGANADLAKCMSQNSNVKDSFTGACTEMCNK